MDNSTSIITTLIIVLLINVMLMQVIKWSQVMTEWKWKDAPSNMRWRYIIGSIVVAWLGFSSTIGTVALFAVNSN